MTGDLLELKVTGGGDLPDGTTLTMDGRLAALTVDTGSGITFPDKETWNLLSRGNPPDWIDGQEVTVSLKFPANTAPTASDGTVTAEEDTAYAFDASDFNFSDFDGNALASVKITTLETAGVLALDGDDVELNDVISRSDIDADKLTYTPAADANGAGHDSFGFKVNDGTADSADAYTMTVDVTAVDDAPTAEDNTVTTDEDTDYTFNLSDFNFADVDEGDFLSLVEITSLETNGELKLRGAAVE